MVYRGHSLLHRVLANCQDDLERRVCGIKPEEDDDYDDMRRKLTVKTITKKTLVGG